MDLLFREARTADAGARTARSAGGGGWDSTLTSEWPHAVPRLRGREPELAALRRFLAGCRTQAACWSCAAKRGSASRLCSARRPRRRRAGPESKNLEQRRLQDAARASFLVSAVQVSSLSIERPQCVAQ
jgi:hypothetical protein